jgi:hypothetical protein
VETIALEVEHIGEQQGFLTKVLTQNAPSLRRPDRATGDHAALIASKARRQAARNAENGIMHAPSPWGVEPRIAVRAMATAYARGEMAAGDAREFEHRFRTDVEFRRAGIVKLLGSADAEAEVAFIAAHPHTAQFNLRRSLWRSSPFRAVFPTLDAGSLCMAGDEGEPRRDEAEQEARRDSIRDKRTQWSVDRSYGLSCEELCGEDDTLVTVRAAIRHGADAYAFGCLTRNQAQCFEQWFIRSRDFRKFVIPWLATARPREDPLKCHGVYLEDEPWRLGDRWPWEAAMDRFKFESSNYEDLEAGRWLWEGQCGRLTLPGVDSITGKAAAGQRGHLVTLILSSAPGRRGIRPWT